MRSKASQRLDKNLQNISIFVKIVLVAFIIIYLKFLTEWKTQKT
jgi:hypothetical protein